MNTTITTSPFTSAMRRTRALTPVELRAAGMLGRFGAWTHVSRPAGADCVPAINAGGVYAVAKQGHPPREDLR